MLDLWNFSFFGRGVVSPTNSELCRFVSGSQAKHQVSSPIIILFKKNFVYIGHHDKVIARCDSIFPLLRCQEVWNKTCTQLCLSQILFRNLKNYSLGDVQRFCYHSWCDSTVILEQISNSCNVYLSSSRFWMATSLVIFYQPPSILKSRKPPKNVCSVQPHSQKPFAPILAFLSHIDRLWNKILRQLSVHFHHPWCIQKTDFTRQVTTCTLSKINKWNLVCEQMLADNNQSAGWPTDRSSSVI